MNPEAVDTCDVNKLHNEVNQYINHRFLLIITAMTVFAAMTGFITTLAFTSTSQGSDASGKSIMPIIFILCSAANMLYGCMYVVGTMIHSDLLLITAYLRLTGKSEWEDHYQRMERAGISPAVRFGYNRTLWFVFVCLTGMTFFLPFAFLLQRPEANSHTFVMGIAHAIISLALFAFACVPPQKNPLLNALFIHTQVKWEKEWAKLSGITFTREPLIATEKRQI